jgi:hypothetical protein
MKIRFENIELFGQKLILHERIASDVHDFNDFVRSEFGNKKVNLIEHAVLCVDVIQDALKANIEQLHWFNFIKKKRYKKTLSSSYLLKNLSAEKRSKLFMKVVEELEITEVSTRKGKSKNSAEMSRDYQVCLVAMHSQIGFDEAERLPITQFKTRLDFAISFSAFKRGDKFDMLSSIDRRMEDIRLHQQLYPEMWN